MTGREDAGDRLRRLLALIPWLLERGGASVAEIADRFDVDERRVERDLTLAGMCGVPPFTADQLIDIWVDEDGTVFAHPGRFFTRPLRFSAAEGFTLLAAGRTLLAVPGSDPEGPLAGAVDKLAAALGSSGAGVDVALEEPEHLEALRAAAAAGDRVEVEYYAASRDDVTRRRIDPLAVFAAEGHWHVVAHCHLAGGERDFRVDRIRSLAATGERFQPRRADVDPAAAFRPGAEAQTVTLLLPTEARWVTESYPTQRVEERDGGRLEVELAVSGRAWLERLLLRVGPDAEVLEPGELRDAGRDAAARLLARYGAR